MTVTSIPANAAPNSRAAVLPSVDKGTSANAAGQFEFVKVNDETSHDAMWNESRRLTVFKVDPARWVEVDLSTPQLLMIRKLKTNGDVVEEVEQQLSTNAYEQAAASPFMPEMAVMALERQRVLDAKIASFGIEEFHELVCPSLAPDAADAVKSTASAIKRRYDLLDCQGRHVREEVLDEHSMSLSGTLRWTEPDEPAHANWVAARKKMEGFAHAGGPISLSRICELHTIICDGLDEHLHPGQFRDRECTSEKGLLYPPQDTVQSSMREMEAWVEDALADGQSPPVVAAVAGRWFISVHPFHDGNGRVMRLIQDWVLAREGFPRVLPTATSITMAREVVCPVSLWKKRNQSLSDAVQSVLFGMMNHIYLLEHKTTAELGVRNAEMLTGTMNSPFK